MSVSIDEIQKNICKLLELNRSILARVSLVELDEMERKLEYLTRINVMLSRLKAIPIFNGQSHTPPTEPGDETPTQESPFAAAIEKERMDMIVSGNPFADNDTKTVSESQSIAATNANNSLSSTTALMFSQALLRSIKADERKADERNDGVPSPCSGLKIDPEASIPHLSPANTVSTAVSYEAPEEACEDCEQQQLKTPDSPRTEYRTISLSPSKG